MSRQAELAPSSRVRARGPKAAEHGRRGRSPSGDGVARSLRASPSAHLGGRREREGREYQAWTRVPSELDPYPLAERDLASAALWQRSMHRSHQRRIRQRDARRNAPRQKGATLAAGAGILALPGPEPADRRRLGVLRAPGRDEGRGHQEGRRQQARRPGCCPYGDTGEAVAAVQSQLRIPADGIFGPQTEGAVKTFQLNSGLAGTGIVDAKTWVEIFRTKVVFYGDADASASSSNSGAAREGQRRLRQRRPGRRRQPGP